MELKVYSSDFVCEQHGKLRDTYQIGKILGKGAYSVVRSLRHRDSGEIRAVKTIDKESLSDQQKNTQFFNQIGILRQLDHPNVVKIYEYYEDEKNYFIVTEACNGGELFDEIIDNGSFSESMAADYMKQILEVIVYLHDRNIVHRDLKPENFLISKSSTSRKIIKIIDFGSAQMSEQGRNLSAKVGTPFYIAPQVLNRKYTEKCDIWSAGVVLYIMLCGDPPFFGNTDQQILSRVRNGRFSFPSPDWDNISFQAKDLIIKMLAYHQNQRISARQALGHTWLHHASKIPLNPLSTSIQLTNLKNFRTQRVLKRAVLAFMGSQLSTSSEREQMLSLFKQLDTDGNGSLSRQQLIEGYSRLYDLQDWGNIEQHIDQIMREVDTDQSGEIDYSEFVTATLNQQQLLTTDRLQMAFRAFDLDGSGSISVDELRAILGKHQQYDDEVWVRLINEVDENGDGEIDFKEFVNMMMRV